MSPLVYPQGIAPLSPPFVPPPPEGEDIGDLIADACRFNKPDSAFLEFTPILQGDSLLIFGASAWVKRGLLTDSITMQIFGASEPGITTALTFNPGGDELRVQFPGGEVIFEPLYRDPGAWMHVHWAMDTTQAVDTDRNKVAVNGVQISVASGTFPALNSDQVVGKTEYHGWSRNSGAGNQFFDGYIADAIYVDGIVTVPTDFGRFSADTGEWVRADYVGLYGSNGSRLNFADDTDFGNDASGNNNDWNSNNLNPDDQVLDTPTENYCVMNELNKGGAIALSNGNLDVAQTAVDNTVQGTLSVSEGKWAWEMRTVATSNNPRVGIALASRGQENIPATAGSGFSFYYGPTGNYWDDGVDQGAYGDIYVNALIRVELDLDSNPQTIEFFNDNISQGIVNLGQQGETWVPFTGGAGSIETVETNFGQLDGLTNTPTAGFEELKSSNLPDPAIVKPGEFFTPHPYTGDGLDNRAITVGLAPDLVWTKARDATADGRHLLFDIPRGVGNRLSSDRTQAEAFDADTLQSFDADGFTLGTDAGNQFGINLAGIDVVAWNWKEGTLPGLDIITYTGNAPSVQVVPHNLGVAPKLLITKNRDTTNSWAVYHDGMAAIPEDTFLFLDLADAVAAGGDIWANLKPTAASFSVGNNGNTNGAGQRILAYVFAEVPGFSKFGEYTGNGNVDGPFIECGFRPAYLMLKRTNDAQEWQVYDTGRSSFNTATHLLRPDQAIAETSVTIDNNVDFVSNGVKIRQANSGLNNNGSPYIFAAFADSPFKFARAR